MTGREKEIVRHLNEGDLDRLLTETDSEKVSKRLTFIKRLYKGAPLEDVADDVGMSQSTGSRWARLWNKGGLGLLTPSFGGGRPPKLDEEQRERLLDLLEEGEPWKKHALFCRRVTAISDALTEGFRQANRELDAVWRYGIAQTACLDVSRPCQTAR
jgi:hypothetical protein